MPRQAKTTNEKSMPLAIRQQDLQSFLEASGVSFLPDAAVTCNRTSAALVASNTRAHMDTMGLILREISRKPSPVIVEARFAACRDRSPAI